MVHHLKIAVLFEFTCQDRTILSMEAES